MMRVVVPGAFSNINVRSDTAYISWLEVRDRVPASGGIEPL